MSSDGHHIMLAQGADLEAAMKGTLHFFDSTLLLHYDSVIYRPELTFSAQDPEFWDRVDHGVQENRRQLKRFVDELAVSGIEKIQEMNLIQQGYQSKILHIITHFLDGFIGIDSLLYNLVEDSHWVSEQLRKGIVDKPERYWLIHVDTSFGSRQSASLI